MPKRIRIIDDTFNYTVEESDSKLPIEDESIARSFIWTLRDIVVEDHLVVVVEAELQRRQVVRI